MLVDMAADGRKMKLGCPFVAVVSLLVLQVSGSSFVPEPRDFDGRQEKDIANSDSGVHCSRARSRTAHAIIDEYLLPFLDQQRYNLSTKCRLHPANDMFREQEELKDTLRPTQWQCGTCKKMFRTEEYLDMHFDNRHYDKLDMSPSRCLADICGAIHCDYVSLQTKKRPCNRAAVERNKHLCESLANSCFPPEESLTAKRLHEFFLRQFCDTHTCNREKKHFPRGSGKYKDKAIYLAVSLFVLILLAVFYIAVYMYRRDISMNTMNFKRIAQHSVMKYQAAKRL